MFGVLVSVNACAIANHRIQISWQEKAIIPLALADFVVFVGLYAIDRGMKAEKKLVELEQVCKDIVQMCGARM